MSKHTPTPWRRYAANKVVAGDADFVADTAFRDRDEPAVVSVEISNANAAFIVRACNAHDELVSVLGRMLRAHDSGKYVLREKFADAARAALIKARGNV